MKGQIARITPKALERLKEDFAEELERGKAVRLVLEGFA